MSDPWRRHPSDAKQLAAERLVQVTTVLDGIVQMNLLQPMKPLVGPEFRKIQCQPRLLIDFAKTPYGALQMDADVLVSSASILHHRPDVIPVALPEGQQFTGGDANANARDGVSKQVAAGGEFRNTGVGLRGVC